MKKRNNLLFFCGLILIGLLTACNFQKEYKYETVAGDPLNTRIYTLDNGLKVYLSVNKDKPRVNAYIAVRVGSKNDPAETTGLAHYFEHLMFKGTTQFGVSDYEKEKPLLDEIEQLFETYRQTTDTTERKAIYARIDTLSQAASQFAIPNEYAKLMTAIGSEGTNAYTGYDMTVYLENIPSNEIENWAKIQFDRFSNPVFRLFHTELETVYEEYNMRLVYDQIRVIDTMMNSLFPNHPYGKQTVIGAQEHLKNPSITNVRRYFETYYVPNNMAICMAGDFNPDEVIRIIDQYFGKMKKKEIPQIEVKEEQTIAQPIVKEVIGQEAANIYIAYRLPAANTKEAYIMELIDYMIRNGEAGLIDLNLVQKQKILNGWCHFWNMADHSLFILCGTPKSGQTLDEVRELLLEQLNIIKAGNFEDELHEAVINNFRKNLYYQQQEPAYAAYIMANAFINNIAWKDQVNKIDFQSKVTKQEIIDFCNKYLNDNYVAIYKQEGKPDDPKIEKPQITPIDIDRDVESAFLTAIKSNPTSPMEPVFMDFSKDLEVLNTKSNVPLFYKQNEVNPLFSLFYVFEMGTNNDKLLGTAINYLNFLGTSNRTAEELKKEMFKIACSFGVSVTEDRIVMYLQGLNDHLDKAVDLFEEWLSDPKANREAYDNLVVDVLKKRSDAKLDQRNNFEALLRYARWGSVSPFTNILSEKELKELNPEKLLEVIESLKNYEHKVLYYGSSSPKEITSAINSKHNVADQLTPISVASQFVEQPMNVNTVLLAGYDSPQALIALVSKGGFYDKNIEPVRSLYNSYFSGMDGIVFQEIREARGLAYMAYSTYQDPNKTHLSYYNSAVMGTQADKLEEALEAFTGILNTMPLSETAYQNAQTAMITEIRTGRILRQDVLWQYLWHKEFGYDIDIRKIFFEKIPTLTLDDIQAFQTQYIKGKPFTYCILGKPENLDLDYFKQRGIPVKMLTQRDIFGY